MEQLKRLRTEKGLSQARLAARAGLDPSTVNQIERGARAPSPATLYKLAEALEVGLVELLDDSPKAPAPPSPEPSFDDVFQEQRRVAEMRSALERAVSFRACREAIEAHCRGWETTLAEGTPNRQAREEFLSASQAFLHALELALDAEMFLLRQETGPAASEDAPSDRSELHRAAERYMEVLRRLVETRAAEEGDAAAEQIREQIREWTRRISA